MTSGVPMGSVLEHILFLVYMNDLHETLSSQVRLFAGDTAFYLTAGGSDDGTVLQNDPDRLSGRASGTEFNRSRCQVACVTIARKADTVYRLHGQVLKVITNAKYLEVDISNDLSWNSHIDRITGNDNRTIGYIKGSIKSKSPKVIETAYNTLVRPQLEYAGPIWDSYTKEKVLQFEKKFQRRAAR